MQKFRNWRLVILVCVMTLLGCSHKEVLPGNTDSLEGLESMYNPKGSALQTKNMETNKIRDMDLKEIALSLGAQAGLAHRAEFIDRVLVKNQEDLDKIYDFNALVLEHNVLPPVLLEGRNTLNLADTQTIRISDRTYKVAKQARFITTPPNWRSYLWMDYKQPEYPNVTLLPKNKEEQQVWRYYVIKGWKQGIEQADTILAESTARIKEDYRGMILYRKLLAMNMVSPPFVSHTELGVTGDASEIHIDDQVLRITALPALNVNSQEWHAAVALEKDALKALRKRDKMAQSYDISPKIGWHPVIEPGLDRG